MEINKIYNSDCKSGLKNFPDQSVNCCVTSPPYWGLRDYGVDGQLGLEQTPEEFVQSMVEVFREVKRVLRDDGTLWLNLGDTYWGGGWRGAPLNENSGNIQKAHVGTHCGENVKVGTGKHDLYKSKDLVGIPWMMAFALRADGWYLRQDIIWNKPNPMPESVTDRCTKSHEYIFLLSKSQKYYYDHEAIKQPLKDASLQRLSQDVQSQQGSDRVPGKTNGTMKAVGHKNLQEKGHQLNSFHVARQEGQEWESADGFANKKSVWTVTTKPSKEAHFAMYPQELIVDCIKAGCPENGVVLDPFMGGGTTALVARKMNRNYVGFELNPEYMALANRRLTRELGLFI